MLLSAVSVFVVAQSSSEIPEGLMNNPVLLQLETFAGLQTTRFKTFSCNIDASHILFLFIVLCQCILGARRSAVGLDCALQVGRSRVRFPIMSLEFCHWHNLSGRTVALGSTQPLTEMSRLRLKCDGTRAETIFLLSATRTSRFKSEGESIQSTTDSRGVRISRSNAGYTVFCGSVKGTGYPLHSPVSPSLPLPCVNVCHHISTGIYQEYFLGGKCGRCVGLTTLPPCADCLVLS